MEYEMKKNYKKTIVYTMLFLLTAAICQVSVFAGNDGKQIWQPADKSVLPPRQTAIGEEVAVYRLDRKSLEEVFDKAPREFSDEARTVKTILEIPTPSGKAMRFQIENAPMLASDIAAQFPNWKQFVGQGIDDPTATASFDINDLGFHAYVLSAEGAFIIDPYSQTDQNNYVVYYKGSIGTREDFSCDIPNGKKNESLIKHLFAFPVNDAFSNGTQLRTFRIAVSATKEYTNFFGGNVNTAFAAIQTTVARMNTIYRRDLATTFTLVSGTNTVFTNAGDGGFPDANDSNVASTSLDRNQIVLNNIIGNTNYDIGHVLSRTPNPNGLAASPSLCDNVNKAKGFTGAQTPQGDGFDVDYVAHEIGHQFSMSHTFNNDIDGSCTTRSPDSAYEPASGVTIMGYGGICAPRNLSANSIEFFTLRSFDQSLDYLQNYIPSGADPNVPTGCGTPTANGNNAPTVTTAGNFTIPRLTPFTLTATATDQNGDALTYLWEEFDLNANGATGSVANPNIPGTPTNNTNPNPTRNNTDTDSDANGTIRPIFRAYNATTSGSRTFPSLPYILNAANNSPAGSNQPTMTYTGTLPNAPASGSTNGYVCAPSETCVRGEQLPAISRTMNFRVTVRDNRAGGGGVVDAQSTVTVDGNSGPFRVTALDAFSGESLGGGIPSWQGGSQQTVTWDVANTNAAPVNAANVNILLSTDGGQTFPTTLLANTPNDGTETITVPNNPTTTARIKIQPTNNIFFDINNTNFTITAGVLLTVNPATLPNGTVGTIYNQTVTASGGTAPYTFATTVGSLPNGLTLTSGGTLSGTPTVTNTFNFTITATDASGATGSRAYTVTIAAAPPQTLVVDTTSDDAALNACTSAPNDCSLRGAIANANSASINDTISFAIPTTDTGCTSNVCTIILTSSELAITTATAAGTLTITNAGGANNVVVSGNNSRRLFSVSSGANLMLDSLTVTGGNGVGASQNGFGGGILNNGGTLTVNNSTISNNTATSGNSGGGIGIPDNSNAVTTINNSTITGNTTALLGGGIRNGTNTTLTVTNSTITNNTSSGANGGGIRNTGGTVTLTNTIVAGNINATSPDVSNTGTVTASYSLIGSNGGNTITNGTNGNQVGTNASPINPLLAPLANNGGKTRTHALQTGSPAIDKGRTQGTPGIAEVLPNTLALIEKEFSAANALIPTATTDQRGFARPYDDPAITNASGGDGADIGAFEVQSPTAANASISGKVVTMDGRGISNVWITVSGGSLSQPRTIRTSSFGYYNIPDLAAGEIYVIEIRSNRYSFTNPTRIISLTEEISEQNFIAEQ